MSAAYKSKAFSISKYLPVLFLMLFLSLFAHLGNIPLFDADEGAYSEVSREMVVRQNFTTVLLNDMPFFHKPPLLYWAQAASIMIMGLNEFSLRLPSAIAALLWVVSIFLFTRRCYDTWTAWHAALFMSGSLLVTLIGRAATPEALLNLFLTLTLLNIYRFYFTGSKRHIYWTYMFAALGVLTKGAIAILLPAAVSFIFLSSKKKWRNLLLLFTNPVGLMVFGLIVIPWYFGEYLLHGEAVLSDLLLLQGTESFNYNFIGGSLPYYSYPIYLLLGLLPFTAICIQAIFHIKELFTDDLIKFMVLWFLLAFLFLPLSPPKSVFAVTYGLPPLFIIMARAADFLRQSIIIFIGPLLIMVFLLLMPHIVPYIAGPMDHEFTKNVLQNGAASLDNYYQMILGATILLLAILPFVNSVPAAVKLGILGLLFVSIANFLVLPILGTILQQPIKAAALLAKKERLTVLTWKIHPPSFNVYAEMLTEVRTPKAGDIILTKTDYLGNDLEYRRLFEKQGIILVKIMDRRAPETSRNRENENRL